jgi:hypothetical protein
MIQQRFTTCIVAQRRCACIRAGVLALAHCALETT